MITQEEWISRSKITHNNFYDYSLVEFINYKLPVTIVCPVHGKYNQNLKEHSRGSRCPLCAKESRKLLTTSTTEDFITKAKLVHGAKYNYDKVNYISAKQFIIITCNVHGDFKQLPSNHLVSKGCLQCARDNMKSSFEVFTKKAKRIYNDYYDYSLFEYKNRNTKGIVICPIHGSFSITPGHHLDSKGCRQCGINRRKELQKDDYASFVEKSKLVHGDTYGYKGEYRGSKIKIEIVCSVHGSFFMKPNNHKQGQGCPQCGKSLRGWNFSKWHEAGRQSKYFESYKVYVIKCFNDSEEFIKIGKTFNSLASRFCSQFEMPYNYEVIKEFIFEDGISCSQYEYKLHKRLSRFKYKPLISFQGQTECFSFECINCYE